jgi:hypothetical protein
MDQVLERINFTREGRIIYIHCATSGKVAGSIPDEATGFLNWLNPSSRTMAMGST